MSLIRRKPLFGVADQVRHKPDCTATEVEIMLNVTGKKLLSKTFGSK